MSLSVLLAFGLMASEPMVAEAKDPKKPTRVEKPTRQSPPPRQAPRQTSRPRAEKPARSAPRQTSRQRNNEPAARQAPRQNNRPKVERPPTRQQQTRPTPTRPQRVQPQPQRETAPRERPSNPSSRSFGNGTSNSPTYSYRPKLDKDPRVRNREDRDDRGRRNHTYGDASGYREYGKASTRQASRDRDRGNYRHRDDYRYGRRHGGRYSYGFHPSYRWYRPGYAYFDGFLGYNGYGRWGWGYYSPIYCNFYGSFWAWSPALSWYWPSRRVYVDVRHSYDSDTPGALDLDVSPEKAQIFVDGDLVGVADNYDGFPTYLYLPPGTYEVAIFHPGYETIFRQYTIYPGAVIDVEDRMTRGVELHPHERVPTSTKNRDDRMQRNRERQEEARRMEEDARRWTEEREGGAPPEPRADAESSSGVAGESIRTDESVGRLLLDIVPPDAAVYLDGNFLGTAAEVSGMSAGLVVEPGQHSLEVTRPGYVWRQIEVSVDSGEKLQLNIELEPGSP